jgi:polysaccharide export outer membrane protein
MPTKSFARAAILAGLPGLLLAGCSTLPGSGPTAHEIVRGGRPDQNSIGFRIVDVNAQVVRDVAQRTMAADEALPTLSTMAAPGRNDVVGPGDVLTVGVYEVGVALFGSNNDTGASFDPAAKGQSFPTVVVDREGAISLPYVGRVQVAGRTPAEIQTLIERGLRGKSQNPQALVSVRLNVSDTVFVSGDVRRPGRFDLSLQNERLLDAIALAGGADYSSEDTVVRFTRGGRSLEERLARIRSGAADDLVLVPGDRVELIKRPRSFLVMGASTRVSQVSFETGDLSLAEAVARAGGPTDSSADPSAVFLFRYDPALAGSGEAPVIYRLNMMQPVNYFLSQRFSVRDKDVIYIANAASNRPAKFVAIINQLFSPFVAARALSN